MRIKGSILEIANESIYQRKKMNDAGFNTFHIYPMSGETFRNKSDAFAKYFPLLSGCLNHKLCRNVFYTNNLRCFYITILEIEYRSNGYDNRTT